VNLPSPLELKPMNDESVKRTFEWVTQPDLQRDFMIRETPSLDTHLAYFEKKLKDPTQRTFAIFYQEQHVGNCGVKNILKDQEAELWIYLGVERVRGRGIGLASTKLLISRAVNDFNLKSLYLHVLASNVAAVKMYEKARFKKSEGLLGSEWLQREEGIEILRMESKVDF
jgi:RimJ/RimL family protein N-acetyltransferase